MNPSSSLGRATQRQLVPFSATTSENVMQQAPDRSTWNETAFDPYGGTYSWISPYGLPHSSDAHRGGPVAMSYNDTLQRSAADVAVDNDYRTSAVRVVTVTEFPCQYPLSRSSSLALTHAFRFLAPTLRILHSGSLLMPAMTRHVLAILLLPGGLYDRRPWP